MKRVLFPLLLLSVASVQAATYISNFNTSPGNNIAGWDGWTINDPENDSSSSMAFGVTWNASRAVALGGEFATPSISLVQLAHAYDEVFGNTSASFSFTIADAVLYEGRDTFGFSFKDGSTNLFSVIFVPTVPDETAPAETLAFWNLYSVSSGGTIPLNIQIEEGVGYNLSLAFSGNGSSTDFDLDVGGLQRSGTIAVDPSTIASSFALEWQADYASDNYIVMDNLAIVPEPSSTLLLGLSGLGFVLRRKRA